MEEPADPVEAAECFMKKRSRTIKKEEERARQVSRQRAQVDRVLGKIGCLDLFKSLEHHLRQLIYSCRNPPPQMTFDASTIDATEARSLQPRISAAMLEREKEETPKDDLNISLEEYWMTFVPVHGCVRTILQELGTSPRLQQLESRLNEVSKTLSYSVLAQALWRIHAFLVKISRLDRGTLSVACRAEPGESRMKLVFQISKQNPIEIKMVIDSFARPVYRAGGQVECHKEIEWISWSRSLRNGLAEGPELPVFVQSHALHRLQERLGEINEVSHIWLMKSLRKPVVVETRDDGSALVEFRVLDHRIGYLVAKQVEESMVIVTFLFLTMQGTPEARLLYQRLKLARSAIEYIGLDSLDAFLNSDLAHDPLLSKLLEECGCGHLLRLPKVTDPTSGYAAELRRFLRLEAQENLQAVTSLLNHDPLNHPIQLLDQRDIRTARRSILISG